MLVSYYLPGNSLARPPALRARRHSVHVGTPPEEDSELPKVLLKVLFWALLKVLLLGKVLFKVLKKVLEIVQYPKKC